MPQAADTGLTSQKKPLHVLFCTNAAAIKGPDIFPRPTHAPIMPCHFPRSFKVTMSETIMAESEAIPPFATPDRPRKTYSIVASRERPQRKSETVRRASAERRTDFLPSLFVSYFASFTFPPKPEDIPNKSLILPYSTWNIVFAISALVPAQLIVSSAFRSRPIVGRATPIPVWSTKHMKCDNASAENTTRSFLRGRRFV